MNMRKFSQGLIKMQEIILPDDMLLICDSFLTE